MKARIRNKYINRRIPCVHCEDFQECYFAPIDRICKYSGEYCFICKAYKPQYPLKFIKE